MPNEPQSFYMTCVDRFHDTLNELCGFSRIAGMPDLYPFGTKAVAELLSSPEIEQKYANDREQYMYVLVSMCVQTGVAHASLYRKEAAHFEKNVQLLNKNNLPFIYSMALAAEMGTDGEQGAEMCSRIFSDWQTLVPKVWNPQTHAEDLFDSFMACYQLGLSWYIGKTL